MFYPKPSFILVETDRTWNSVSGSPQHSSCNNSGLARRFCPMLNEMCRIWEERYKQVAQASGVEQVLSRGLFPLSGAYIVCNSGKRSWSKPNMNCC